MHQNADNIALEFHVLKKGNKIDILNLVQYRTTVNIDMVLKYNLAYFQGFLDECL